MMGWLLFEFVNDDEINGNACANADGIHQYIPWIVRAAKKWDVLRLQYFNYRSKSKREAGSYDAGCMHGQVLSQG